MATVGVKGLNSTPSSTLESVHMPLAVYAVCAYIKWLNYIVIEPLIFSMNFELSRPYIGPRLRHSARQRATTIWIDTSDFKNTIV